MKALSIKQPWASLIAHGVKNIENRTWRTNFRGRIYIHASGKSSGALYELLNEQQLDSMVNHWTSVPLPHMPLSAIIGEVDIVDCVLNHNSIWAKRSWLANNVTEAPMEEHEKDYFIWNWVLANPVLYDKPIVNVKGKLSFWEFNPDKS